MAWQSVLPSFALVSVSLVPLILQHANPALAAASLLLNPAFLHFAGRLALVQSNRSARRLLLASIIYLPLVFVLEALVRS